MLTKLISKVFLSKDRNLQKNMKHIFSIYDMIKECLTSISIYFYSRNHCVSYHVHTNTQTHTHTHTHTYTNTHTHTRIQS